MFTPSAAHHQCISTSLHRRIDPLDFNQLSCKPHSSFYGFNSFLSPTCIPLQLSILLLLYHCRLQIAVGCGSRRIHVSPFARRPDNVLLPYAPLLPFACINLWPVFPILITPDVNSQELASLHTTIDSKNNTRDKCVAIY